MKIKVCGLKDNVQEVASLDVDYLGFIFHEASPRSFDKNKLDFNPKQPKVAVTVNQSFEFVSDLIEKFKFEIIQLHGQETPEFCQKLKSKHSTIQIWKVFHLTDQMPNQQMNDYPMVDLFLLEPKGKNEGGNGIKLNWDLLQQYQPKQNFILSGGIEPTDAETLLQISNDNPKLEILDLNSKFEISPGFKDVEKLKKFTKQIKNQQP